MATITTSWKSYASKTVTFSSGFKVAFYLEARYTSQSTSNNTTSIQTRLRSDVISGSGNGANYKFTCTYANTVSGSGVWYLADEVITTSSTKTITHNANGTKTITISATASISGIGLSTSLSASVAMPTINRIAQITSAYDFAILPEVVFTNPANFNLYLGIDIIDKNNHGVYTIQLPTMAKYTSPYVFDIHDELDAIWQNTTTQKSYKARYYVQTMNGSSQIGSDTYDATFSITDALPSFSATYQDTNSTTTAITGDNQKIIQNQSTLQINITNAEGKKYATLSTLTAEINGVTYNGTITGTTGVINVGTINVSEDITANVTLTDSRGYTTTKQLALSVLSWSLPTANITLARENNYYSETDITVDANYSSLDNSNTITIQTRYKKTTDENYGNWETLQDNITSTLTLDNLYEWDVQVKITDIFGSTTYNLTLAKGMPIIYFDRLKRSVGVECFPANTESLEVKGVDLVQDKQDTLVSGTNIKTINNTSLLGSGNITIGGGGTATDVQINGTSITSSNTANIRTNSAYNASSNKIATMSDVPTVPTNISSFTNDAGYITKSVNDLTNYTLSSALSTVATSGSYNDLSNTPTIPTVNDGKLTFYKNNAKVTDFTANSSTNVIVDLTNNVDDVQINGTSILSSGNADIKTNSTYNASTNKIATMSDIPSVGNGKTYYGVCNTGSFTATKEVSITGFVLETGAIVVIKFSYGNDVTNTPLLKINSESAKYMKIGNNTLTYKWGINAVLTFVYDGTDFILIEPEKATSSNYGLTTLTDSISSTSTTTAATPNSVKTAYDLANGKQDALVSGTNIKTINSTSLLGSGDITISTFSGSYNDLTDKPSIPTITDTYSSSSSDGMSGIAVASAISTKQDTLIGTETTGQNIKTINGTTLLGTGNITIGGGGTATDVKINGTSITSGGEADIITYGTYNASTNKIATMSDVGNNIVVDHTVTSDTNSINFTGLNILPGETYKFKIVGSATTNADIYMKVNDSTNADYYQVGYYSSGSLTADGNLTTSYVFRKSKTQFQAGLQLRANHTIIEGEISINTVLSNSRKCPVIKWEDRCVWNGNQYFSKMTGIYGTSVDAITKISLSNATFTTGTRIQIVKVRNDFTI